MMLTYDKVLEVFSDYLAEDDDCEVLSSRRGILVLAWESCEGNSVTATLCASPKELLDILRASFESYQLYVLTDGYEREDTEQDAQEAQHRAAELAALCEEN